MNWFFLIMFSLFIAIPAYFSHFLKKRKAYYSLAVLFSYLIVSVSFLSLRWIFGVHGDIAGFLEIIVSLIILGIFGLLFMVPFFFENKKQINKNNGTINEVINDKNSKQCRFCFRLPLIYLITFPFYIIVTMLMMSLGVVNYLLAFWFNPILMILVFIDPIIRVPFAFRDLFITFVSNLIFWFLVGLLIDKIIYNKFKNKNT